MTSNWFYLVLIYIFTNSTSKLIQKHTLKDEEVDPTAFSAFWHFTVGIISIPYLFFEKLSYPQDIRIWGIVVLSGSLYAFGMLLFYHALKNIEVSQSETISNTRSIWLMILGILFFAETLNWSKIIGVSLIFIGLVIIYWKKDEGNSFEKPHVYILVYSFLISSAYALDKYALQYFSVGLYNVLMYLLPAFFTVIILPKTVSRIKCLIKPRKNNYLIFLSCIVQMVSTLSLYAAYKIGELSVVGPLAQTSTVFTIVLGILVLKERWNLKRKLIGLAFSLLGIVFLRFLVF